jgi:HemY protein
MAALAVALVMAARYGTAYVVFVLPPWGIVDMSMILFAVLAIGIFLLVHWLLRAGVQAWHLPRTLKSRQHERARNLARDDVFAGLKALFSGQFRDAEQHARRAMSAEAANEETRDLAAALAGWAAHEHGNADAAVPYLDRIRNEQAGEMRDVSKAYMLLSDGRAKEALQILKQLAATHPRNAGMLKMKVEAEVAEKAWSDVLATLAALTRTGLMPEAAAQQIRLNAQLNLLRSQPGNRDALMDTWKGLETESRYDLTLAATVAKRLIDLGCGNDAREIIEETIDKRGAEHWDSALAGLYADCKSDSTLAQIDRAEKWLKQQPRDPVLLATLGKLCMRQALWGKAQSYLEASVALQPTLDAHMTLARLMEQIGRRDESIRHIRRGADLAS